MDTMTTPRDLWVPLTDDKGAPMVPPEGLAEPLPGSILLTQGSHGTAWQRYFSDELWHRVGGGRARSWDEMLAERNLVLVYDADVRR